MIKFLTAERKEMYMQDFNNNVISCNADYWKLDEDIIDTLTLINKHQDRQTLYSKKCTTLEIDLPTSYLLLSVTEKFSEKLKDFEKVLSKKYGEFFLEIREPDPDFVGDIKTKEVKDLGCNSNKEHFNTSVFHFELFSCDLEEHNMIYINY